MDFQRARSEEQRNERRRSILATTASMLTEMPVAELSLNELSRRVGLAKSNVLRYFESREAILLELLDAELRDWVDEIARAAVPEESEPGARATRFARLVADSLATRPVLCDLVSAQAAVLERNISTEVALHHKRTTAVSANVLVEAIRRHVDLEPDVAYRLLAYTLLMTSAAWPQSQPSEAVCAAYAADPEIAATQMDFADALADFVVVTIAGLSAGRTRPA
ncbi:TetR family transcriptional regulator [Pseudonocardia halophobica]|uniref:TetR family transcriptional regulator n=1 Tax=Pseudonocardia halophobica TaxID=29401 RepID=A0A9W6NV59_9PSEU|nr:TetR/AcrR family transcriptional regulator [Pseudonocardia halophobica]GLL10514.1 TetR family transcriptional regulator [Pseudonocardia halophobica]